MAFLCFFHFVGAVVLNSFLLKRQFFANKKVISRIFREPHVYLSRGSHVKIFAKSFAEKKLSRTQRKSFPGSDVETRRPWQLKTLTWTIRTYGVVWWCMFFLVITASATINSRVYGLYRMGTITIKCCSDPPEKICIKKKLGYTRALKMREKCSYRVRIPPILWRKFLRGSNRRRGEVLWEWHAPA